MKKLIAATVFALMYGTAFAQQPRSADRNGETRNDERCQARFCQIASNSDPPFACKDDPASVRECFASDGAETGGAEPHIAEQSRSWRASSSEREVMRGS